MTGICLLLGSIFLGFAIIAAADAIVTQLKLVVAELKAITAAHREFFGPVEISASLAKGDLVSFGLDEFAKSVSRSQRDK